MNETITYKNGRTFPPPVVYAGYVIILLGITASIFGGILGLFLALIATLVSFARNYTEIDLSERSIREYNKLLFLDFGGKKSLDNYKSISILGRTIAYSVLSRGMRSSSDKDKFYDVCLLNQTHRQKLVVKRCKSHGMRDFRDFLVQYRGNHQGCLPA